MIHSFYEGGHARQTCAHCGAGLDKVSEECPKGRPSWVQCTSVTNECLGGCRTKKEHDRYTSDHRSGWVDLNGIDRPSWDSIWLQLAWTIAERSTCSRLKVGCVIVTEDNQHVLALGYNGNYRGGPNACDSDEVGKCGCLHSECNSLLKLRYTGGQTKVAYITHLPCRSCAKMLVNADIDRVVYQEKYRDMSSLEILEDAGLDVRQYTEES